MSGVAVRFNPEDRVMQLSFYGDAVAVYSGGQIDWIPSDRPLMLGLTAHTDEAGFRRLLGVPIREAQERMPP